MYISHSGGVNIRRKNGGFEKATKGNVRGEKGLLNRGK